MENTNMVSIHPFCISFVSIQGWNEPGYKESSTWCGEGAELVEEVGVFLLATHSAYCAHVQRQVHDQLAGGQLVHLQDILHVVEIADQQVVLVDGGDEACEVSKKFTMAVFAAHLLWSNLNQCVPWLERVEWTEKMLRGLCLNVVIFTQRPLEGSAAQP